MTRTKLFFTFALVFVPLVVLTSAPAPTDKLHLAPAGKVKVDKLVVNDATPIDENRVAIIGRQGSTEDMGLDIPGANEGVPNGALIDLAKKSVQPFTNQHTTQIWGVAHCGGRVLTNSAEFSTTVLRSWDLKAQESKEVVKLTGIGCRLRSLHKSDRVVAGLVEQLLVFRPTNPKERLELACPADMEHLSEPLAVSPNDTWIACAGDKDQVVCFEVATRKIMVAPIAPKGEADQWSVHGLAFAPSGKLFVCRHGNADEVPKGKAEKDVPAERRGIVRIDLPEGRAVPLNMGHTAGTWGCAVDGTETWLATVGQDGDGGGELRVYNLSSGKLAYREKLKGGNPQWVWFTPSGKRIVCVTTDGMVRWWDVPAR